MNWVTLLTTPLVVLWLLAGAVDGQADGDFWWLRATTDATPEPTAIPSDKPPCECVKYYLCVNGTISTSGAGIIDIRLGGGHRPPPRNRDASSVTHCPDLYDVCCLPPPPPSSSTTMVTTTTTTTTPQPTLPPDTPCECVSLVNCTVERLVSDGGGNTSIEALGFLNSHSACPHAFTVCCALEPTTPASPLVVTIQPPTSNHPHCDCVDVHLCGPRGTIITSGAGLLDLRTSYMHPNPNITCEDPRQMCCNKPPPELVSGTTTSPTTTDTTTTTTTVPTTLPPIIPSCGTRNELGVAARILGFKDGESQFGEFPWVAAILRREYMGDKPFVLFIGGGTLIHPRIIVTAAHKVIGVRPKKLVIRLGEWDTQTQYEAHPHQNIEVEEVVIHPNFEERTLYHDIALLILKEEARRAPHIDVICEADDISTVDGSACIINGWGKDGFEDSGAYQMIMKSLTLPLVDHPTCQSQLRHTRLGPYFRLHRSFLCAGGELGKDACTGDGGGPLACPRLDDPTRYLLVGITAWGIGCGQDGIPGVYVSIPANVAWIRNQTYSHFPPPPTTTTAAATTTTPSPTTTTMEVSEEEEEYDYDYSFYEEWEERKKRKQARKQRQREEKKRQKEEKKRRRQERRRRRQEDEPREVK